MTWLLRQIILLRFFILPEVDRCVEYAYIAIHLIVFQERVAKVWRDVTWPESKELYTVDQISKCCVNDN